MTGAIRPGQVMYAITRGRSGFSASATTISRPTGTIIAPPAPWSTRMATSVPRSVAAAQASEARVKTVMAVRKTRRAPKRAVSQPLSGISTASVSR